MSSRISSAVTGSNRELWTIKNGKGRWFTWARVQVVTDTVNLVGEKVTKPIRQIGTGDVWWERGSAGLAQQFAGHSEELPAGRTGVDLLTVEPSLGILNTRLHNSPLLGLDFPVDCETGRSPSSLCQSPSPSSLPDLLGHPRGRKGGLSRVWWRTGRGGQELDEARHCRHRRG